MSIPMTRECKPDPRGDEHAPAWFCLNHAGWTFADDECEGAIGSLHCNTCINTGCQGADNCDCHNPADPRHQEAFA